MRISDWSSDVCSSDLPDAPLRPAAPARSRLRRHRDPGAKAFAQRNPRPGTGRRAGRGGMMARQWMCGPCGFIYDESAGLPNDGIAPGTAFEDIPDDWACPDCGLSKADFFLIPD